ncbi:MAG: tetratricopeptide repeat protein [Gammaproteobacteria bacterium]|nr:tetratricopeptide repeat protein [Gammaproteobacteria bacterium]
MAGRQGGRAHEAVGGRRSRSWRGALRRTGRSVGLCLFVLAAACSPAPAEPDPALVEAIDWYTGVAGTVDDSRARELLEEAVDRGGVLSLMWLARVHSTGRMGFPGDEERARAIAAEVIDEVERAAEAGVLEAVFLMGTAYDEGLGKPVDPVQAADWHRRAGERGHVLGAHNLGNQYAAGRGVEEDHALAAEWWLRAAERGDAITQLRLGEAYEAGRGVPLDLERAREWYGRAGAAGNAQAREALERLAPNRSA